MTLAAPPTRSAARAAAGPAVVALWRRVLAEGLGTGLLVTAIVGSGVTAARLSPEHAGLQLACHSLAVGLTLAVLIAVFAPVSGAHLNPVVTLAGWLRGPGRQGAAATAATYLPAQLGGGLAGAVAANLMFDLPPVAWSGTVRTGAGVWWGEVLATGGLVLVIVALTRTGRTGAVPWAVGGWIAAACWFTASSAFANPAVTVGRMFTDSFTGIAPGSVPAFLAAQLLGGLLGAAAGSLLWPGKERT